MNEHDLLNEVLGQACEPVPSRQVPVNDHVQAESASSDYSQWIVGPNDTFRPTGKTIRKVPAGVYGTKYDSNGLYFEKLPIKTDDLFILPDSANDRMLAGMEKFWNSKDKYAKRGLLYKRGMLLWGAPGGGKTATLQLLIQQLVKMGGIVIVSETPSLTVAGLIALRRIERHRNIIVILEDVDETIQRHGEHELLALLDGESQTDNICCVATTNYPERLGARIVNRPSRFDERIHVDMPTAEARTVYLKKIEPDLDEETLNKWVADTDNMSVAHLRELAAAVLCLEQPYDDVITRLRSMKIRPRETTGFGNGSGVGFDIMSAKQAITRR